MADFQALEEKYAPVVDAVKKFEPYGAKFVGSELAGEQYHLVAQVPSQVVLNRVWDEIKKVDPQYADLKHEITNTGGQEDHYTLAAGDTLSKVSQLYYGSASKFEAIANASGIADPSRVQVGQKLTVPVL